MVSKLLFAYGKYSSAPQAVSVLDFLVSNNTTLDNMSIDVTDSGTSIWDKLLIGNYALIIRETMSKINFKIPTSQK